MDKKYRPYLIALAIMALIVIAYMLLKDSGAKTVPAPVTPKEESKSDTLLNIFNELFGNGQAKEYYCRIFPKACVKKYCDCSKPGFAVDGAADSFCNEGGLQFEKDCK